MGCRPVIRMDGSLRVLGILLIGTLLLAGCNEPSQSVHLSGQVAGARYVVTIDDAGGITAKAVKARIARLSGESAKSVYGARLSAFNQAKPGQWIKVSSPLARLVDDALKTGRAVDGAVDITDGAIRAAWGAADKPRPTSVPTTSELNTARDHSGLGLIDVRHDPAALRKNRAGVKIALGSLEQSDMVDRIAGALDDMGADRYLVSLAGAIRVRGRKTGGQPWQVGVEPPGRNADDIAGVIGLDDAAMATAGHSQRFIDIGEARLSPQLDPRTGRPVSHSGLSVTVVADSALHADLMARALLVMGPRLGSAYATRHHLAAFFCSAAGLGQVKTSHTPSFGPMLDPD